jgi:hypothetical protein
MGMVTASWRRGLTGPNAGGRQYSKAGISAKTYARVPLPLGGCVTSGREKDKSVACDRADVSALGTEEKQLVEEGW